MPQNYRITQTIALFRNCVVLAVLLCISGAQAGNSYSYDFNRTCVIGRIELVGNAVTKPPIILRELVFASGDTIERASLPGLLAQSEKNLLNTGLFNFITIDTVSSPLSRIVIDIRISVIERWYIWPNPILKITDRNFNTWWASRDYTRINYGFRTVWSNFRGRMENLELMLRFGKNHEYSLLYDKPYLGRKKQVGAGFGAGYSRSREIGYSTKSDKLVFLFDRNFLMSERFASVHFTYRPKIHTSHLAEIRFHSILFSDSLIRSNPAYSYSGFQELTYFNFYYKLKIDHRDIKYYPLSGWYADLEINKDGFGFGFEKPVDIFWVKSSSRIFLPVTERWYLGAGLIAKISSSAYQPYFSAQGLGFERDYVRGYEYYVVDGQYYLVAKTTFKYALIQPFTANIGFIPTTKFSKVHFASYLTVFADAGYTWLSHNQDSISNQLPESLLIGTGVGLDLVTYYDKVMRIEYSLNKMGESGIFIHLIAGI